MKKIISIISVFLLIIGISGCGANTNKKGACGAGDPQVVMVTDTGGIEDKSFNQGTWEGIQQACSDLGVGGTYIQTTNESELEGNLRRAAQEGKIVVAVGFSFEKVIAKVAQEFPDVKFVAIDAQPTDEAGNPVTLPNVFSYFFKEAEAGYLVGYIAGKKTKTNHVGFVGGIKNPAVQHFGYGYIQGVQAANPNAIVEYQYADSFTDVSKGQQIANSMIASGTDIIFTAGGAVNNGVIEASITQTKSNPSQPISVIGVDRDMYQDGVYDGDKSVILTSAVKNTGNAAFNAIKTLKDGQTPPNVSYLNVNDGYVGLPEKNPNLANDQTIIEDAKVSLHQAVSASDLATDEDAVASVITITINGDY